MLTGFGPEVEEASVFCMPGRPHLLTAEDVIADENELTLCTEC